MWYRWQLVLPLALLTWSYAAAKPTTQDTLVVSRSDNEDSTPSPSTEVTSEEPNPPIKLTEMDVQSKISLRYAHTAVVTRVRNPAKRAQETTFRMLLPDTAFISGFTMTIDGKAYKAYVKEKEEAKQIYSDAVSQGFGAAHIAAKARDSNHFTVTVNVEPSSTVLFNLTYEELLVRRNGVYNHAVNLHPGNVVPKMKVTVHIKEVEKISALRVPEVRTGNEVDAMDNDPQNAIAVINKTHDDREAIITFTPDVKEQRRLMQVYAEKSKESLENHRYYEDEEDEEKKDKEGVLGQFVVQYDVDRSKAGEILVSDGYFVHFFAPSSLPPLPKHVVFVLDTSGSMMGRKVEQLRDAMKTILGELHKNDYFSIVEFNSYVEVLDLKKADETESTPKRYYYFDRPAEATKLLPPSRATPDNIAKAKIIVSKLEAGGGTNIASALDTAVELIRKGVDWLPKANRTESKTELEPVAAPEDKSKNDSKDPVEVKNKLEPIVIFLTDGDPTVGETDPTRIINRLSEKNYGEEKASIFTLAFGSDADRKFLRKLSLRNEGFMRHIYEAADAALQLRDFYRSVSSPLLADVKFLYPKSQIKEGSLTKHHFRTYYAGSEAVVAGRLDDSATEIAPQVLAFCGVDDSLGRTRYEISPKIPVVQNSNSYYPLERLWAYLTIKQLLDQKDALIESSEVKDKDAKKDLEKKALDIALKYEMVTPLTSLVVVKPNDTKAVDAESVDDNHENIDLAPSRLYSGSMPNGPLYAMAGPTRFHSAPVSLGSFGNLAALKRPIYAASLPAGPFVVSDLLPQPFNGLSPQLSLQSSHHLAADSYAFEEEEDGGGETETFVPVPTGTRRPPLKKFTLRRWKGEVTQVPAVDSTQFSFVNDRIVSGPSGSSYLTTPIDIRVSFEPPTNATADPLEPYSLQQLPWTTSLLDAASDSLLLSVNGTQLNLKLFKDNIAAPTAPGAECANAAGGGAGRCQYLTRCAAAKDLSAALYQASFCVYDTQYAGVCCPEQKEDTPKSQNP